MIVIVFIYAQLFCYLYLAITPNYIRLIKKAAPANTSTYWQAVKSKKEKIAWWHWGVTTLLFSGFLIWADAYAPWTEESRLISVSAYFIWISGLLTLAKTDRQIFLLPDVITLPLWVFGVVLLSLSSTGIFYTHFIPSLGIYAFGLLLNYLIQKKTDRIFIGLGDIKLIAVLCIWTGLSLTVTSLFTSSFFLLINAMLKKGKKTTHMYVPFGPYLVFSAFLTLFTKNMI